MCAQRKGGLGRGLGALLPVSDNEISDESVRMVDVSVIQSNPHQPRVDFNEDELKELTDSIL
ncbi:MAG TPA: stage 0 sporulation protein J, partial [Flexilinea sp.]|nr:stage 0 sporulation protein J [Flexilinea sp.]